MLEYPDLATRYIQVIVFGQVTWLNAAQTLAE